MSMLTENEVILLQLPSPDLFLERVPTDVDIAVHPRLVEDCLDLLYVFIGRFHDGNNQDLTW